MIRRMLLVFLGAGAAFLVPWTVYLAHTLPDRYDIGQWRTAWVGFDVALLACFAAATWLGLRRRRAAVPLLAATAALLCCDAWFDVMLDWTSPGRSTSIVLAVCAEVPIAVLLLLAARRLLADGVRRRPVTVRDIERHSHPSYQQLMRTLDDLAPVTAYELAGATGRPAADVGESLGVLGSEGSVRQRRDGRWTGVPQYLREPRPDEFDEPHRSLVADFLVQTYDRELRLLTWAASHREEFGPWGKSQRATARLTETDLRALEAEYLELLTRYCHLRRRATPGARMVALRFYAFPPPEGGTA